MIFYGKTILLPNLSALYTLLNKGKIESDCFFFIGSKIAIQHYEKNGKHSIRICKIKTIFAYWYPISVFVGALDYTVESDHIKIVFLSVNDDEYKNIYKESLDESTAQELKMNMIHFINSVAINQYVPKIVVNVHQNLRLYEKYYKKNGFVLTNRRCEENPCWIEAERYIE